MKKYASSSDLLWRCPSCHQQNQEPMHSDPQAHFVSMVCGFCEAETEGCFCLEGIIIDLKSQTKINGSRGGQKLLKQRGKKYFKELIKKRWNK